METRERPKVPVSAPDPGEVHGLMTLDDAAALLACTTAAVRKWIAQGRLERVKLGRLTRVRRGDVVKIVQQGLPDRCR